MLRVQVTWSLVGTEDLDWRATDVHSGTTLFPSFRSRIIVASVPDLIDSAVTNCV